MGNAYCTDGVGECFVAFNGKIVTEPNYYVVETDYENYSVVYSCDPEIEFAYLFYLSRDPVASDEQMD